MTQLFSSDNQHKIIKTRHSFYETRSPNDSVPSKSQTFSRSDVNIVRTNDFPSIIDSGRVNRYGLPVKEANSEEYYKNYEHDIVPVKDDSCCSNDPLSDSAAMGDRKELTNSDLDNMEVRIFRNISKEQLNDSSTQSSLESNIKIFKTTVQEIFDNFNSNMRDFDLYKKKFQNILSKNKENIQVVDEMEHFIKEMIYIISSESCVTRASKRTDLQTYTKNSSVVTSEFDSTTFSHDTGDQKFKIQKTVEAYKNENYFTDSTVDKDSSKMNRNESKEKSFNIYLLSGDPCVEIKMDGRNLLSEINIRHPHMEVADQIASAENIKSIAEKKLQLQKYMNHRVECQSDDKIIPVKISYAKKNIHSEDCPDDVDENNKSFIYKICNYLCRKLRRNSFG